MACALIALGANLSQRRATLERAVAVLGDHPKITIARISRFYESLPAGGRAGQGLFLNAAAVLETTLTSETLLATLLAVEDQLGRKRDTRWDARTVDLDLLLYEDAVIETKTLILPHPRMAFRRFVLEPAAEIAPDMRHPTIGWTISELLEHLDTADPVILVVAAPGPEMEPLVEAIRELAVDQLDSPSVIAGPTAEIPVEFEGRRPKLAVFLGTSTESSWRNVPLEGPLLRLGNVTRGAGLAEVAAAIEAMKPVRVVE